MSEYAVVDDYGDDWETGIIVFSAPSTEECRCWAEGENFHSASIVLIEDGVRVQKVN